MHKNLLPVTRCDHNGTLNPHGTHGKIIVWTIHRKGKTIKAMDRPFVIIKLWEDWIHAEDNG